MSKVNDGGPGCEMIIDLTRCEVASRGDKVCGKPAFGTVKVCECGSHTQGKAIVVEKGACEEHIKDYIPQPKRCPQCREAVLTRNVPWTEWWEWYCPKNDSHFKEAFWPRDLSNLEPPELSCWSMHWADQADGLGECPICHKPLYDSNGRRVSLAPEETAALQRTLKDALGRLDEVQERIAAIRIRQQKLESETDAIAERDKAQ